jgi:hypothetical protein
MFPKMRIVRSMTTGASSSEGGMALSGLSVRRA